MIFRRLVPLLIVGASIALVAYITFVPPKVAGQNCCQFPTSEQEISEGAAPQPALVQFEMTLSDPQGTDFSAEGDSSSGQVGESTPIDGEDACYDNDPNAGIPPVVRVSTPEPTYYWDVGHVGYCTQGNGACPSGPLNWYEPIQVTNGFGYDAVGYDESFSPNPVLTYRNDLITSGKLSSCGFSYTQRMSNYCIFTFFWRPYVDNDLAGVIYQLYVTDCKNTVCKSLSD